MKIPGWVWGLLVVVLLAAIDFLGGEQFSTFDWAPFVVLILTTVVSALKLWLSQRPPEGETVRALEEPAPSFSFSSWWLKG